MVKRECDVWQEVLHNNYLRNKTLPKFKAKPTDSPFSNGHVRIKEALIEGFFQK
jgi:hypothetical protein